MEVDVRAEIEVDRPAAQVWVVVADYGRDPLWRAGVTTMAPEPPGVVREGTTTAEVLRFAGMTWRSGGLVLNVEPGRRFSWQTTSGLDAEGDRDVEPLGAGRCRVRLHARVRPSGGQRILGPVLAPMLRRTLTGDLRRLRALVEGR